MSGRWLLLIIAAMAFLSNACSSSGGGGATDKGAPIPAGIQPQPTGGTGRAAITFDLQGRQARISDTAVNILINILHPVTQVPLAQPVTVPVDRSGPTQTVTITLPVGDVLLLVETLDANGNVLDVGTGVVNVSENSTASISITLRPFDQTVVGVPSELVFVSQPATAGQNQSLGTVQVAVQDGNGRLIASATDSITVAIASNPSGGILNGTVTANAVNGVATFSNLSINNPGVGYTLLAAATGRNSSVSASFDIAAVPAALAVAVPPTNTPQLAPITPGVQISILDQNGVVVPGATNSVTVSLASGTGTLSGTLTVNAVNGVATFSDLSIDQVGTGFSLLFTSPGLVQVTSATFDTTNAPGVPTQIAFLVQPSNTDVNQTITPAVQVVVQDFFGATVANATNDVTLSLSTNPAGANLNGTLTVAAVNGVAVFNNLSLDNAGTGFVLGAVSTGLTGATSNAFNINAVVGPPVAFFGQQNFIGVDVGGSRQFSGPNDCVAADFNTDGRMDFATGGNVNTNNPRVFLNTSAAGTLIPTFTVTGIQASNSGAFDVVSADVNTDGRPDLITNPGINTPTQQFQVLLNTTASGAATPSFGPPSNFNSFIPGSGLGGYVNFDFADLNADGREDIVLGFTFGSGFTACINTTVSGSNIAGFSAPAEFTAGTVEGIVRLGDVDGDGRPDVVLSGSGALYVALNTTAPGAAAASFAAPVQFNPTGGGTVDWPALGDFDGDSLLDLATADRSQNRVRIWRNLTPLGGPPNFVQNSLINTGFSTNRTEVGDFNNDGRADLVVNNQNQNGALPANQNSASVLINSNLAGAIGFEPINNFPTTLNPFGLAPADFNDDGVLDLGVATSDSFNYMTTILIGTTPNGATAASFSLGNFLQSGNGPSSVDHADFNTDGDEDLIAANHTDGSASVFLNSGGGVFAPTVFAAGTQPTAVLVADLNTDGRPDAFTVNNVSNDITVLMNTTPGGAGTPTFSLGSLPVGAQPLRAAVADFNQDGRPDLAIMLSGGNFTRVLLNTTVSGAGAATFAAPVDLGTPTPTDVVTGDFSGDGASDVGVVSNGAVQIFANTTPVGGATASFAAAFTVAGIQPSRLTAADINADGRPDLANNTRVFMNTTTGGALSFTNNAIGQFQTFTTVFMVSGDVNADGLPELLIGDEPGYDFCFLRNTTASGAATPAFASPLYWLAGDWSNRPTNTRFGGATMADFTGDGRVDIAVAAPGTGSLNPLIRGNVLILPQQ